MHCVCINILCRGQTESIHGHSYSTMPPTDTRRHASRTRARVAIAGATGYAGQELVRILARHPAVTLTAAMSSGATSAPRPLPALARIFEGAVVPLDVDRLATEADVVFLALPEAASAELAPHVAGSGRAGHRSVRCVPHPRRRRSATLVSRHGRLCRREPSTACPSGSSRRLRRRASYRIPAAIPRLPCSLSNRSDRTVLLTGTIVIDAKSGISGAGKSPSERTHFSENHGSVAAYSVFSHRHTAEIEQELESAVTFVPHLVPLDRGILETIYASLRPGATAQQVGDALRAAYATAPFVRLTDGRAA